MPYVREKLATIVGGWGESNSAEKLMQYAEKQGWWDLWTAIVRTTHDSKLFNRETQRLLDDKQLDSSARKERLRGLAGVSREWSWPGFGLARVHSLDDDTAVVLYQRYPELLRGPFKSHVVPNWRGGPKLLAAALDASDEELVDLLASRYVTRVGYDSAWNRKEQSKTLASAGDLSAIYQSLRDRDQATFARRAANILTQIPAFAI